MEAKVAYQTLSDARQRSQYDRQQVLQLQKTFLRCLSMLMRSQGYLQRWRRVT